jgi:hypothetical protein
MPGDMHYSRWSESRKKMTWMRQISMLQPRRVHELEDQVMPARRTGVADLLGKPRLLGGTPRVL